MTRPRALLFDWDNTLVDSWETIHEALRHTFAAMGHEPWSLAEVKARTRLSLKDAFPALFGARWSEARQLYYDRFLAIHLERITPLPGAEAMLTHLHAEGFPLGVVSNKTGRVLRLEADHFAWTPHFASLVGAGDAEADKPAAAPVRMALEAAGISDSAEVWYVGDTALDMECAANAGCRPVLLHTDHEAESEFVHFPPALRFSDCEALVTYIKGL